MGKTFKYDKEAGFVENFQWARQRKRRRQNHRQQIENQYGLEDTSYQLFMAEISRPLNNGRRSRKK